jgi:hypothetical protein
MLSSKFHSLTLVSEFPDHQIEVRPDGSLPIPARQPALKIDMAKVAELRQWSTELLGKFGRK